MAKLDFTFGKERYLEALEVFAKIDLTDDFYGNDRSRLIEDMITSAEKLLRKIETIFNISDQESVCTFLAHEIGVLQKNIKQLNSDDEFIVDEALKSVMIRNQAIGSFDYLEIE